MRRKYTNGERAIVIVGRLAGKSLEEINAAIAEDEGLSEARNTRRDPVPETSWDMQDAYAKSFGATDVDPGVWQGLWDHLTSPKTLGGLGGEHRVHRRRRAHATDKKAV